MSDLFHLLNHHNCWQGLRVPTDSRARVFPTGISPLDQALHGGGWPLATAEVMVPEVGVGELSLLLPGLAQLEGNIAVLDPPCRPYVQGWSLQGVDGRRTLLVETTSRQDRLWAAEQLLRSGCFAAVLHWDLSASYRYKQLLRLQQAARSGGCLHVLYRALAAANSASPSALRLLVSRDKNTSVVGIIKQPGGWGGQRVVLPVGFDWWQPGLGEEVSTAETRAR